MRNEGEDAAVMARAIIKASGPMPDPARHFNYLMGLKLGVLKERLDIIQSQRRPGADISYMERAVARTELEAAA